MRTVTKRHPKLVFTGIILFWTAFAFIWTYYGWTNDGMFTEGWMFDTVGHIIFGIGAAFSLLCFFPLHLLPTPMRVIGVVGLVALLAIGWEIVEATWDFYFQPVHFEWLAKAQKSGLDTTIDIVAAVVAATIEITIHVVIYKHFFPDYYDEDERERIEAMITHIVGEYARAKRERREGVAKAIARKIKRALPHFSR